MGNVNATVDPNGNVEYQVFDAFGNLMGGGTMMNCDPASARMAASGRAQWRGAEGSQTDYNSSDLNANASEVNQYYWPTSHKRFTKKTSGLMFMQNRFYDPGTGRFTQKDPVAFGMETIFNGQNNRWVYCANDPVNCSDPSGLFVNILAVAAAGIAALLGLILEAAFGVGFALSCQSPVAGTILGVALMALIGALLIKGAFTGLAGSIVGMSVLGAGTVIPILGVVIGIVFAGLALGAVAGVLSSLLIGGVNYIYDSITTLGPAQFKPPIGWTP